jgi:hypothetical protein
MRLEVAGQRGTAVSFLMNIMWCNPIFLFKKNK